MARFYIPDPHRKPEAGEDIPKETLKALAANLAPDDSVIICADITEGSKESERREADLVIITSRALHVIEVKDLRDPLVVTPNGPWTERDASGNLSPVRANLRGGHEEPPDLQAKKNADLVQEIYCRTGLPKMAYARDSKPRAYPYVLIPRPNSQNEIAKGRGAWVRIVEGVDELFTELSQRDSEALQQTNYCPKDQDIRRFIKHLGVQGVSRLRGVDLSGKESGVVLGNRGTGAGQATLRSLAQQPEENRSPAASSPSTASDHSNADIAAQNEYEFLGLDTLRRLAEGLDSGVDILSQLRRAQALLDEKRFEEAVEVLRQECEDAGNHVAPHVLLGDTYLELGQWAKAVRVYNDAVGLLWSGDRRTRTVLYKLALAYFKQNLQREAFDACQRAITESPDWADPYLLLGEILSSLGEFEEAFRALQSALDINPDLQGVHGSMGNVHFQLGRWDEAIREYQLEAYKHPSSAAAMNAWLAWLYCDLGRRGDAVSACRRALEHNPEDASVCTRVGDVHQRLGYLDEAQKAYQKALAITPDDAALHLRLAQVFQSKRRYPDAISSAERAKELGEPEANMLLAKLRG